MKTYEVVIPITGSYQCTVEVDDDATPDDIYDAAIEQCEGADDGGVNWEFCQVVCEGNVFHGEANEWEFSEVKK